MNNKRKETFLIAILLFPAITTLAQNYISSTFPAQNQIFISRTAQLKIGFSEIMDTSTLNNNSVVVTGMLSGRHYGNIAYDNSNNMMTYNSNKSFACGERVFATVTSDIKNQSGIPQSPPYCFSFYVKSDSGHKVMRKTKSQNVSELVGVLDVKVADMDGDGDYDLIFSNQGMYQTNSTITIYKNDGQANFAASYNYLLQDLNWDISTGDFNNDLIQDIAVVTNNSIEILSNSGNDQLYLYASVEMEYPDVLVSCDFNNDGKTDLLSLEYDDSTYPFKRKVCFIKNMGNGNFEKLYSYEFLNSSLFYCDIADINNDGFIDLILSIVNENKVLLLINNGEGVFYEEGIIITEGRPFSLAVGDYDRDSDIDISIATEASIVWNGLKIYVKSGNNFYYVLSYYLHSRPKKTISSDFNNDGNLDVASVFGYGGRVGLYFGTNTLFFSEPYQVGTDENAEFMEYADFDSDGDIDLITINDYWAYRNIYFLENGAIPQVPVELTSFTAAANGNDIVLKWSSATELNNFGFEIQRSLDGKEFFSIGFVSGSGTTTGQHNYTFTHKNLENGKYYYRLKQVDYDGSFKFSDVVEVNFRVFNSYLLEQNYPNPFNPKTSIGFGIQNKSKVKITVLNLTGEEVAVLVNDEKDAGFHTVEFNAAELPNGIYFYQMKTGDFVQMKKMILMK